jgi:hypothetical protein
MRAPRYICAVTVILVALLLPGMIDPAGAHGGEGVVTVESRQPAGANAIRYVVRLTWSLDGHAASSAHLIATPVDAVGVQGTPTYMAPMDYDGRYTGTVVLPSAGPWTVKFTSHNPPTNATTVETTALPVT